MTIEETVFIGGNYNVVILKADGILLRYEFDEKELIFISKNEALDKKIILGICITDGGRFICCGGEWPYFVVFDVYDSENIIILENFDSEFNSQLLNITASRNGFKIATTTSNIACVYDFNTLGNGTNGNFRKSKPSRS